MMKRKKRGEDPQVVAGQKAIDSANRKTDDEFIHDYLQSAMGKPSPWVTAWTTGKEPSSTTTYHLSLSRSRNTSEEDLTACFDLISETSKEDYIKSSKGWDANDKRKEMRDKDLRYILAKNADGVVCGFTSFKPDFEEGQLVVYCYEIHLKKMLRNTGLAMALMNMLETVATNLPPIEKVMLTVFKRNKRALRFYEKFGFVKDDLSPTTRTLRGRIMEPDYVILSKSVSCAIDAGREDFDTQENPSDTVESRPAKMLRLISKHTGAGEEELEASKNGSEDMQVDGWVGQRA